MCILNWIYEEVINMEKEEYKVKIENLIRETGVSLILLNNKTIVKTVELITEALENTWIDIKDKLPEINDTVLVFNKYGNYTVASYEVLDGENYFFEQQEHTDVSEVTHWQSLPNHPK